MKRKFIINPSSGQGIPKSYIENLKNYFIKHTGSFDFVLTKGPGDIKFQSSKAIKSGYEQLVAVGGDGTVSHVVKSFFDSKGKIINSNIKLAISNIGTGSDYFKSISIITLRSIFQSAVGYPRIRIRYIIMVTNTCENNK